MGGKGLFLVKKKVLKRGFSKSSHPKNFKREILNDSNHFDDECNNDDLIIEPDHINPDQIMSDDLNHVEEHDKISKVNENDDIIMNHHQDNEFTFYIYQEEKIFQNITVRLQENISQPFALHDSLTGLYNRELFEEELKRLDTERQMPLSIIMGDVNGLKLVNDVFGHVAGDQHLIKFAAILKDSCRKEDIIARWGGDEFIVLLPGTQTETVKGISQRIQENCQKVKTESIPLSIALGMATKNKPNENIKNILKYAEEEMYHAKTLQSVQIRENLLASLKERFWKVKRLYREEGNSHSLHLHLEIGQKLQLNQQSLNDLLLLASLHDIGKITVPIEILLKKDSLLPEDWGILKKIPEISFRIFQYFPNTLKISEPALSYCEWWDGSGYPQGLSGENIPYLTRISTIINAYDLMIHPRPFKNQLASPMALAEIQNKAGTQFDPQIVSLFLKTMGERMESTSMPGNDPGTRRG